MTMTLWIIIALGITITLPKHFSDQAAVMGAVGERGEGCWEELFLQRQIFVVKVFIYKWRRSRQTRLTISQRSQRMTNCDSARSDAKSYSLKSMIWKNTVHIVK